MSTDARKKAQLQEKYNKFNQAPKYNLNSEELFCICRKIDDGELMVACDGCDEWFHFKCMKLNDKYKDLVNNYYCLFCDELFDRGKTLWKKKCRLPRCYNPIEINESQNKISKYCSEEHGLEFMKEEVLRRFKNSKKETTLKDHELVTIIKSVGDFKTFKNLGNELPRFDKEYLSMPEDIETNLKSIDIDLVNLKNAEKLYGSKEKYLLKLKELIKHFNDEMTAIEEKEAGAAASSQNNKAKKTKKAKKSKVDICGFDTHLRMKDNEWLQFVVTEEYSKFVNFAGLEDLGIDKEVFEKEYIALKHAEEDNEDEDGINQMVEQSETIFKDICLNDKKKCIRHLTWFGIYQDNIKLKLNEAEIKITELDEDKEKIFRDFNIRSWENWNLNNRSVNSVI